MAWNQEKSTEGNGSQKCNWCHKGDSDKIKIEVKISLQYISCKTQNILNKDSSKELNINIFQTVRTKSSKQILQSIFFQ